MKQEKKIGKDEREKLVSKTNKGAIFREKNEWGKKDEKHIEKRWKKTKEEERNIEDKIKPS